MSTRRIERDPYHSILGALDALVDDFPPRTLERANVIPVVGPVAQHLLQGQVAVREDGLLAAGALGSRDGVHLVDHGGRRIAVGAGAVGDDM